MKKIMKWLVRGTCVIGGKRADMGESLVFEPAITTLSDFLMKEDMCIGCWKI